MITKVVAALIWEDGKLLICQRPENKALPLLWEFPGGKVEAGESLEEALIRECSEELGITIAPQILYEELEHIYPEMHIKLSLFHSSIAEGTPKLLEHHAFHWCSPEDLGNLPFCPADLSLIEKLKKLPPPILQH